MKPTINNFRKICGLNREDFCCCCREQLLPHPTRPYPVCIFWYIICMPSALQRLRPLAVVLENLQTPRPRGALRATLRRPLLGAAPQAIFGGFPDMNLEVQEYRASRLGWRSGCFLRCKVKLFGCRAAASSHAQKRQFQTRSCKCIGARTFSKHVWHGAACKVLSTAATRSMGTCSRQHAAGGHYVAYCSMLIRLSCTAKRV